MAEKTKRESKPAVPKDSVGVRRNSPRDASTPIGISKRLRNVLLALAFVALVLIFWFAPSVPVTLLGGFAVALALSFPVRWLSMVMPRVLALLVTFLGLAGLVAFALFVLVPTLIEQLIDFAGDLPGFADEARDLVLGLLQPLYDRGLLQGSPDDFLPRLGNDLVSLAQQLSGQVLGSLVGFVSGAFGLALSVFGVLFVAVYLLINVRGIKFTYLKASPKRYRRDVRDLWDAFALSLSRYLSGLAFVMLVQGALSAIALYLLGVPYALLLGAWVALTAVIPYLGSWLGAAPAVILAFTESPTIGIVTAVVFLAIQQLEGNLLTPRIQGEAVNLPSILIFLGIIAGGQLAGLLGVLFAVPALAVLRVLYDFFRARIYVKE